MLLFYAKYVFIFWVLMASYRGNMMLMRQLSEDEALLNLTACSKHCLIKMPQKVRSTGAHSKLLDFNMIQFCRTLLPATNTVRTTIPAI